MLVDTAGRLHTKTNLMDELEKLRRIVDRTPGALKEVLLVIDASTGQNGLVQAKQFADAVDVTGIALTKLDGTAKGGIVLAIQSELGIPVKIVGVGEGIGDLIEFDPAEFAGCAIRGLRAGVRLTGGSLPGCVRRTERSSRRHLFQAPQPRAAERTRRRRDLARDPARAARGRRQRPRRQVVHRPGEGTRGRRRGRPGLDPGQQFIKIVHEELVATLGGTTGKLTMSPKPPTVLMLAGLQGSGKTTAAAKLARLLKSQGLQPLLVGADLQRPAAVEQLRVLAGRVDVPFYSEATDPVSVARGAIDEAQRLGRNFVIVDTAGRLQIDTELMDELRADRRRGASRTTRCSSSTR